MRNKYSSCRILAILLCFVLLMGSPGVTALAANMPDEQTGTQNVTEMIPEGGMLRDGNTTEYELITDCDWTRGALYFKQNGMPAGPIFAEGTYVTVVVMTQEGYQLHDVTISYTQNGEEHSETIVIYDDLNDSELYGFFYMPSADTTVTATFDQVHTVSLEQGEHIGILTCDKESAIEGCEVCITAYGSYEMETQIVSLAAVYMENGVEKQLSLSPNGQFGTDFYFTMPDADVIVRAVYEPYSWASVQKWIDYAPNGTVIMLSSDTVAEEVDSALTIGENRALTLDLNNHQLNRSMSDAAAGGNVITNNGTLTVKGRGTVTGGKNSQKGGGIINNGTLNISRCTVTGNDSADDGGGIYNTGTLDLSGGTVTGNNSANDGGGIYNAGMLDLSGGTVTGNSASGEEGKGGGILQNGTLNLSGSPVVTGNTAAQGNNIYLCDEHQVVTVTDTIGGSAKLGITTATAPTAGNPVVFTEGLFGYGDADAFVSEDEQYEVRLDDAGEALLVFLNTLSFESGREDATGTMEPVKGALGDVISLPGCGFTIPEGWQFGGWQIGGDPADIRGEDEELILTGDMTVTAVWRKLFKVIIDDDITNGQVSTDIREALAGTTVTLTTEPDDGYRMTSLTVSYEDGLGETQEVVIADDGTFTLPAADVVVTATFEKLRKVVIDSSIENGSVEADREEGLAGETVTLTTTPEEGYAPTLLRVIYEDENGQTQEVPIADDGTFVLPAADVLVTSAFEKLRKVVIDGNIEHGRVEADREEGLAGETVALTVTPDDGYAKPLLRVTYEDENGQTQEVTIADDGTFVLPAADVLVTAAFEKLRKVVIDSSIEHGSVEADREEGLAGETVTLTVTPDDGYVLTLLRVTYEDESGQAKEVTIADDGTFVLPAADVLVTAAFEKLRKVVIDAGIANGNVEADREEGLAGETVALTVTPDDGYVLTLLRVTYEDENGQTQDVPISDDGTFVLPAADVAVTAAFKRLYKVTISGDISLGTVQADRETAMAGETVTLTVNPDGHYERKSLSITYKDEQGETKTDTVEGTDFIMPDSDVTVEAEFQGQMFTITVSDAIQGGSVEISATARYGDHVYFDSISPDAGYELNSSGDITWTGEDGTTGRGYGSGSRFYIIMPAANITVAVAFTIPVRVCGVSVTGTNCGDILGDGSAFYDIDTGTLTLNNPILTLILDDSYMIFSKNSLIVDAPNGLTLTDERVTQGISVGNGTLTVNAGKPLTIRTSGYCLVGNQGVTVHGDVTAESTAAYAIYSYSGPVSLKGSVEAIGKQYAIAGGKGVTLTGGPVLATGGVFAPNGDVRAECDVSVSGSQGRISANSGNIEIDGNVSVEETGNQAISAGGNIRISGSVIAKSTNAYGIKANGSLLLGGNVEAAGTQFGLSAKSITLNAGSVSATGGTMGIFATSGDVVIGNRVTRVEAEVTGSGPFAVLAQEGNLEIADSLTIITPENGENAGSYIVDADGERAKHIVIERQPLTEPVFQSHSLVLGGQIGVNFLLELPELDDVDYTNSYMEFSVNDTVSTMQYDPERKNQSGLYYLFTCYVNAVQMADEITAVFHYTQGGVEKTVSELYSVESYIRAIDGAESYGAKVKNLVRALADYGHYAQIYLANERGWVIGTDHIAMDTYYTDGYTDSDIRDIRTAVADYGIAGGKTDDMKKVTFSLKLDSNTVIYLYYTMKDGYSGAFSAKINGGKTRAQKLSDGRYRVTVSGLSAHMLGDPYVVSVITDSGAADVTLSALSYVKRCIDSPKNPEESSAIAALYRYYEAAVAYKQ